MTRFFQTWLGASAGLFLATVGLVMMQSGAGLVMVGGGFGLMMSGLVAVILVITD